MAWYDSITKGIEAIGDSVTAFGVAVATLVVGLGGALLKARRELARQNSQIVVEKSDAKANTWLNQALIDQAQRSEQQAVKADAAKDATITAAKELLDQRMVDLDKIARTEERLRHLEEDIIECRDRAQRAETRAAVAEDHMRKQAEQILVMSMNIDSLTTELAKHDPAAAKRLAPVRRVQPLLTEDLLTPEEPKS